jgi:glycosyltransferase involved in cell wall biosynthesis
MLINHVLATEQKSRIFDDLIKSYAQYSSHDHVTSLDPIDDADVYIHHRINKSNSIPRKSIAFVHHDLMDIDPAFSLKQYLIPIKKTSGVICLNTLQRKALLEGGVKSRIEIIPHGYACTVEATNIYQSTSHKKSQSELYADDKKTVLFINSRRYLRCVKGESNLRILVKDLDVNSYEFQFCGKHRVIDTIYAKNNGFTAVYHQPRSYLSSLELYNQADLLLNLSWYEGGPANLPEAISTSTPVITRRIGIAFDLYGPDYPGFFESYDDLYKKLSYWRTSNTFRDELISHTNDAATRLLSQADVSHTIDKLCEQILK